MADIPSYGILCLSNVTVIYHWGKQNVSFYGQTPALLNESLERDLQWCIPHRLPEDEFRVLETKTHTSVT